MIEWKNLFYDMYGLGDDAWTSFEQRNNPLMRMKCMLTRGKELTRIEQTAKQCMRHIEGFVDEVDEEGWHHFVAPMRHFTAEYWQRTNCTLISINVMVAEEMKLEKRTFTFANRYWRYYYQLSDLDYDFSCFLRMKHWFETEKPRDDRVYKSIVDFLSPFKGHIRYSISFDSLNYCMVTLHVEDMEATIGSTQALIHYDSCLDDLKSALSLLLMKQLIRVKDEILSLKVKQGVIMGMVGELGVEG